MTQEDKQLLLKDLCARLPYEVEILADIEKEFDGGAVGELVGILPYNGKKDDIKEPLFYQKGCLTPLTIEEIRPYLRPMSSMTEEEKEEYEMLQVYPGFKTNHTDLTDMYDWLNEKMFDYRGLIEKGLALKAPEDMYKEIAL